MERAEREREAHGRGAPLEGGQVAGGGGRPSNARGNALGANAPPPRAAEWPAAAWRARTPGGGAGGAELVLSAPPGVPSGDLLARKLTARFREDGAEITLAAPPFPAWRLKVAVPGGAGACDPARCRTEALPGAAGARPSVSSWSSPRAPRGGLGLPPFPGPGVQGMSARSCPPLKPGRKPFPNTPGWTASARSPSTFRYRECTRSPLKKCRYASGSFPWT